jgi:hypothetical protein
MTHASPGKGRVLYAVPVTLDDLNGDVGEAIAGTMHLLQCRIRAAYAVRLTAVDGRMFAAAVHAHSEAAAVDWRSDYDALIIGVEPRCRRFVVTRVVNVPERVAPTQRDTEPALP